MVFTELCPSITHSYEPPHVLKLNEERLLEQDAWKRLTSARDLFEYAQMVASMNTGSAKKCEGAQRIMQQRINPEIGVYQCPLPGYKEPLSSSARKTALDKARMAHEATGKPSVGSDAVFWIWDGKQWNWQTKLERQDHELSNEEIVQEIRRLHFLYVEQERLKCVWDVAMAIVNGGENVASHYVVIDAEPMEEQEFWAFINESLASGMFYNSNSRGCLIEFLVSHNKIKNIGFVPFEYMHGKQGIVDVRQWMQKCTPHLGQLAISCIDKTTPEAITEW